MDLQRSFMEQGGKTLLIPLEMGELMDLGLLPRLQGGLPGAAACNVVIRDQRCLEYQLGGFYSLERLIQTTWKKKQFLTIEQNLVRAVQGLLRQGIPERCIQLDIPRVFVNQKGEILLTVVPLENYIAPSLRDLLREMIFQFSFDNTEDNTYITSLLGYLNGQETMNSQESLNMAGYLNLLSGMLPGAPQDARFYSPSSRPAAGQAQQPLQAAASHTTLITDAALLKERMQQAAEAKAEAEAKARAEAEAKARAEAEAKARAEAEAKAKAEAEAKARAEAEAKARAEAEARAKAEAEAKAKAEAEAKAKAEAEAKAKEEAEKKPKSRSRAKAKTPPEKPDIVEPVPPICHETDVFAEYFIRREKTGEIFWIVTEHCVLGRSPNSDYCILGNPAVGRTHAELILRDGGWMLVDKQSKNHSYINGRQISPLTEVPISPGDRIVLADEALIFGKSPKPVKVN